MNPKLCRTRRTHGGIFLIIFVAVAVGAILVGGVWIALKVRSWANHLNNNRKDDAAAVQSFPMVLVAAQVAQPTALEPEVHAAPEPTIVVLESTNLIDWTRCPLTATEVLLNLHYRRDLTNSMNFYRIIYE